MLSETAEMQTLECFTILVCSGEKTGAVHQDVKSDCLQLEGLWPCFILLFKLFVLSRFSSTGLCALYKYKGDYKNTWCSAVSSKTNICFLLC